MDPSKIRDILVVGPPTKANQELTDLFGDQIITLAQVVKELRLPGKEVWGINLLALYPD